ncbi:pyridoxamine kinase [Clostridium tetani]|uniref:pyridoxal kinase n=2 Tax=Clostridium tetani TaxID=1513 RepID=A0A4Q0VAU6_CLOTA|nr:pyridoxamine kinase [Clostridium tetani]RXI45710.1 pyridoxamine kinase [Clostridium tetani]RXI74976.1 pyridoxamine kinase [Clostridium tetani]RXI77291.1 pyridoxamine kinase [Clostridium tetani]
MINMTQPVKKIAAIHDLSGFGRASLTTVIPILSTMGFQVCPMPTAILSTHTGEFQDYTFLDLTNSMIDFMNHWKSLNLEFDCIYSGFLGSSQQIEIVSEFIDIFGNKNNLKVIDPVMGDNGRLYSTMGGKMVENMRKLIKKADIITPNFTEAAYLLDKNIDDDINECTIKDWLRKLSDNGPKIVIITSVPDINHNQCTNVMAYNKDDDMFWKIGCKYIPASYPGTGDIFTSVLTGSLLQGDSLPIALDRSTQFITTCIKASYGFKYPNREGVLLERVLNTLNMPVIMSSYEIL